MTTHKLPNYLRMYRKRAGFTQGEMAYLLGTRDGTKVSRYERRARTPTLETALTYEAIFRVPVSELFAGIADTMTTESRRRGRALEGRLRQIAIDKRTVRKLESLGHIVSHRP